ncbi:vacuolar protein sorting-associated protein 8 [Pseudoscourfieldia marina]
MSSLRSSISGDDALADVDALDEVVGDDAMDVEHLLSRYGGSSSSSSSSAVSAASSPRAPASMGVVGVHGVDDPLAGLGSTLNVAQREVTLSDTMNMRPAAAPRSVESVDGDGMSTVDHIGSDAGASTIYSYTTHRAAHGSPRSPRSVAPTGSISPTSCVSDTPSLAPSVWSLDGGMPPPWGGIDKERERATASTSSAGALQMPGSSRTPTVSEHGETADERASLPPLGRLVERGTEEEQKETTSPPQLPSPPPPPVIPDVDTALRHVNEDLATFGVEGSRALTVSPLSHDHAGSILSAAVQHVPTLPSLSEVSIEAELAAPPPPPPGAMYLEAMQRREAEAVGGASEQGAKPAVGPAGDQDAEARRHQHRHLVSTFARAAADGQSARQAAFASGGAQTDSRACGGFPAVASRVGALAVAASEDLLSRQTASALTEAYGDATCTCACARMAFIGTAKGYTLCFDTALAGGSNAQSSGGIKLVYALHDTPQQPVAGALGAVTCLAAARRGGDAGATTSSESADAAMVSLHVLTGYAGGAVVFWELPQRATNQGQTADGQQQGAGQHPRKLKVLADAHPAATRCCRFAVGSGAMRAFTCDAAGSLRVWKLARGSLGLGGTSVTSREIIPGGNAAGAIADVASIPVPTVDPVSSAPAGNVAGASASEDSDESTASLAISAAGAAIALVGDALLRASEDPTELWAVFTAKGGSVLRHQMSKLDVMLRFKPPPRLPSDRPDTPRPEPRIAWRPVVGSLSLAVAWGGGVSIYVIPAAAARRGAAAAAQQPSSGGSTEPQAAPTAAMDSESTLACAIALPEGSRAVSCHWLSPAALAVADQSGGVSIMRYSPPGDNGKVAAALHFIEAIPLAAQDALPSTDALAAASSWAGAGPCVFAIDPKMHLRRVRWLTLSARSKALMACSDWPGSLFASICAFLCANGQSSLLPKSESGDGSIEAAILGGAPPRAAPDALGALASELARSFCEHHLTTAVELGTAQNQTLERAARTAIGLCLLCEQHTFALEELLELFQLNGCENLYLEALEPFIANGTLRTLPPEAASLLARYLCDTLSQPDRFERLALSLDVMSMDFNLFYQLCVSHHLTAALVRLVCSDGLADYRSAVEALLTAVETAEGNAAISASATRLLVFVSQTMRGERYPPGRGRLQNTGAEDDARAQVMRWLLDGESAGLSRYLAACMKGSASGDALSQVAHAAWLPFLDATDGWECTLASGARVGQALFDAGAAMLLMSTEDETSTSSLMAPEMREACAYACAFLTCRGRSRASSARQGSISTIVSALAEAAARRREMAAEVEANGDLAGAIAQNDAADLLDGELFPLAEFALAAKPPSLAPGEALSLARTHELPRLEAAALEAEGDALGALMAHLRMIPSQNRTGTKPSIAASSGATQRAFEAARRVLRDELNLPKGTNDALPQRQRSQVLGEVFPALVRIDRTAAAELIATHMPPETRRQLLFESLAAPEAERARFDLLHALLVPPDPIPGAHPPPMEEVELYVDTLCRFAPNDVAPFLARHGGGSADAGMVGGVGASPLLRYRVEAGLAIVQRHGVTDAAAHLMERLGDANGAARIRLTNFEEAVNKLVFAAIRGDAGTGLEAAIMKMSAASTSASPSSTPRSRRASFGGAWDEAASSESTWSTCARALDASAELLLRSGPALSMHTTPRRASTVDASSAAASHSASPKNAADALWLGILRVPLASLRALRRLEADVDVLVAATRGGDAPSTPTFAGQMQPPSLASGALDLSARLGLLRASLAQLCDRTLHKMATESSLNSVARRLVDAAQPDGDAGSVRAALREALSSCRHEVEALSAVSAALRYDAASSMYALRGVRASAARGCAITFLSEAIDEVPAFAARSPASRDKLGTFAPAPMPRTPGSLPDHPALGRSII